MHGALGSFDFFAGESHGRPFLAYLRSVNATRTASAASTLPIT
jgi:hypothetical protein